jgi:EpsI family protein
MADAQSAALPASIELPQVPGWNRVTYRPSVGWQPLAQGADHRLLGRYADARGNQVDVFLAVYGSQGEGHEAGGFGQGAMPSGGIWVWQSPGPALDGARGDRLLAEGRVARLAYTWYRTGNLITGSNARLKLAAMADRLLLRPRLTTMLILSAEENGGQSARPAIDAFLRATGPTDRWMDRTAGLR